jgi:DNA-damage-inducible protein J
MIKEKSYMNKNDTINIRVNPETKANAESLYAEFGMTISEAINIFLHQSIIENGIPFKIKKPRYSRETMEALQEAKDIASGKIKREPIRDIKKFLEGIE